MRKRWSRWWRSSPAMSSGDPSANSDEVVVDLVEERSFLHHGLSGGERREQGGFWSV
jgi:hypothetical protein